MSDVSPAEAVKRLRQFSEVEFVKTMRNAIGRALTRGRKQAYDAVRATSVGRKIVTRRKKYGQSGLVPLVVKRSRIRETNDYATGQRSFSAGLEAYGFAALIEKGGATKAHLIRPVTGGKQKGAGRLLFQTKAGHWVSPKAVRHPGSRLPRNPFMEAAGARVEREAVPELEKGVTEALAKAGI